MNRRRLLSSLKTASLGLAAAPAAALSRWAGIEAREGHHFHAPGLGPGSIVVDLGAHLGGFAHPLAARLGCRVYAVEAAPALCARIPAAPSLEKLNFAVGAVSGPVSLFLSANAEANSVSRALAAAWPGAAPARIEVRGVTLEELFRHLRITRADLLKVDVEGAEIGLFDCAPDELLRQTAQITVEFHDFMSEADLGDGVARVIGRLVGLGFVALNYASDGSHGDVLFLNRRKLPLTRAQRLCLYRLLPASLAMRDWCRRRIRGLRARLYGAAP
jgi:FkbM family methyltransferase